MSEQTFFPDEIAEMLRVGSDTVRCWCAAGELESLNVARLGSKKPRYRITESALQRFMASRSVLPPVQSTAAVVRRRCRTTAGEPRRKF